MQISKELRVYLIVRAECTRLCRPNSIIEWPTIVLICGDFLPNFRIPRERGQLDKPWSNLWITCHYSRNVTFLPNQGITLIIRVVNGTRDGPFFHHASHPITVTSHPASRHHAWCPKKSITHPIPSHHVWWKKIFYPASHPIPSRVMWKNLSIPHPIPLSRLTALLNF